MPNTFMASYDAFSFTAKSNPTLLFFDLRILSLSKI